MQTIIIFYKYITIDQPNQILLWQKKLCAHLHLKGRVIIATEGINATLGGTPHAIGIYKKAMSEHPLFGDIDFKESPDSHARFPRLRIVVKDEIVNLGIDPSKLTTQNAGTHLDPAQAHSLLEKKNKDLLILDCRNAAESAIGTMEGSVRPDVHNFRDFPSYVDNNPAVFSDKTVLMYCSAGVRCERASAYIKEKGIAKEVYQIKGGIHRYVEQFPHGFFKGKYYVFDGRVGVKITDDILGSCYICNTPCDEYTNCLRARCNRHFISCKKCTTDYSNTCSAECHQLIMNNIEKRRPQPMKVYDSDEDSNKPLNQ